MPSARKRLKELNIEAQVVPIP